MYARCLGSRHHRSKDLGKEVGSVEWLHGASDPDTGKATFLAWKVKEMQTLLQETEQRYNEIGSTGAALRQF